MKTSFSVGYLDEDIFLKGYRVEELFIRRYLDEDVFLCLVGVTKMIVFLGWYLEEKV